MAEFKHKLLISVYLYNWIPFGVYLLVLFSQTYNNGEVDMAEQWLTSQVGKIQVGKMG